MMSYATETYTTDEIYEMILSYKSNLKASNHLKKEYIRSIKAGGSIAQYGEESGMPKAVGQTGDPTSREVDRLISRDEMINRLENKVRYIQNRWSRILEEEQAIVFHLTLDGRSLRYISDATGHSKDKVKRILMKIAELLQDN